MKKGGSDAFHTFVSGRRWLTATVFEIDLERPTGFSFVPGQKIRIAIENFSREYTLINHPDAARLTLCIRYVAAGRLTPVLSAARIGDCFSISAADGFFTYQPSSRQPVFLATGTGIAPFLAYARAGVCGFLLLQGARSEGDLLYREEMEKAAKKVVVCLSSPEHQPSAVSPHHVTDYLEHHITPGRYDFYLCGNGGMIRDAVRIIDAKFPDSKVFVETFF